MTAFFLFSVGCVNMLVGLIFREKVKDKRSILSWRERGKDALPTHVQGVDIRPVTGALSSVFTGSSEKSSDATRVGSSAAPSGRPGMGFGRQAEKTAALRGACAWQRCNTPSLNGSLGFILSKPNESLAKHAA